MFIRLKHSQDEASLAVDVMGDLRDMLAIFTEQVEFCKHLITYQLYVALWAASVWGVNVSNLDGAETKMHFLLYCILYST